MDKLVYTIYKTTNTINEKIYYGLHRIRWNGIIKNFSENGSCFVDGYLGSGAILKKALSLYGDDMFSQEIIAVFDTLEEAEQLEREIVNEDFIKLDNNYNINLGGNTNPVMFGEENPFYGKKHKKESLEKIQKTRKENGLPTFQVKILNIETGEIYKGYKETIQAFNIKDTNKNKINNRRSEIYRLCYEGKIQILNEEMHNIAIKNHTEYLEWIETADIRKEEFRKKCSINASGRKHSEENKIEMSNRVKKWIKDNPEKHKEKMEKINKNPEKIRKMAEKHRGMKRSDEAKKNISNSLKGKPGSTKGKISIYNQITLEQKFIEKDNDIPDGWTKGNPNTRKPKGTLYNDGNISKMFINIDDVPDGWVKGGLPKKKKTRNEISK